MAEKGHFSLPGSDISKSRRIEKFWIVDLFLGHQNPWEWPTLVFLYKKHSLLSAYVIIWPRFPYEIWNFLLLFAGGISIPGSLFTLPGCDTSLSSA